MQFLLLLGLLLSTSVLSTVTVPLSELSLAERQSAEELLIDEKNFWRANEIFRGLGEFGIELNESGKCRYLTRRNLLMHGTQADWDCFFAFRGIVRELKYCLPENWSEHSDENKKIRGLLRYVGVAPLPYRYDIIPRAGKLIAKTSIFYKGFSELTEADQEKVKLKVSDGVDLWNENTPTDMPYEIQVDVVDKKEDAHFRVKIIHGRTRGPYLREHSINWSHRVYAHEFGHMLGLDDEYDQIFATLFGNSRCTNDSLMCSSINEGFPRYYWYLIFRRAQCV